MLETIEVENFRGFAQAKIEGLTGLNILVGPNNCGKSTLLEAGLLAAEFQGGRLERTVDFVVQRRGRVSPDAYAALLFNKEWPAGKPGFKLGETMLEVRLKDRNVFLGPDLKFPFGFEQHINLLFHQGISAVFADVDRGREHERLVESRSVAYKNGYYPEWIELLKPLLPGLESLDVVVDPTPVLYLAEKGKLPYPAFAAGDGFIRLMLLAARLSGKPKVAFIEEPEAFIHPGALPQLSKLLWQATNKDTQLVIATHSMELIDSILADPSADLKKLAVYRLRRYDGILKHARLDGEYALMRREELGEDLRQ